MRQCHAQRSRPAGGLLIRREQLLPQAADAVVGRLVNVNMAVLVEAEQRRLRVIADGLKDLIDRSETIGEPITIGKPGMAQQIGNVERMKRRRSAAGGRLARQLEKTCESRKLSLIDSNICNASSGVQAARAAVWTCDWSRSSLPRAPNAAPISCSTQRRTSGGAALSCSKENVKLVVTGSS
jgi:hypothetical protein